MRAAPDPQVRDEPLRPQSRFHDSAPSPEAHPLERTIDLSSRSYYGLIGARHLILRPANVVQDDVPLAALVE